MSMEDDHLFDIVNARLLKQGEKEEIARVINMD